MANTAIQLKKSGVTGNTPVDLQLGEVAINYADGKLYYKDDLDQIQHITNQDTFSTISANGDLILATSPLDVLTIQANNGIHIDTDTGNKTIFLGIDEGALSVYAYANAAFYKANNAGGLTFTDSDTAPTDPKLGDIWYDTTSDILYEWASDGGSFFWLDTTSAAVQSSNASYLSVLANLAFAQANAAFEAANTPITINEQTVYLGNTVTISQIWGDSWDNENMVTPVHSDPAWGFGSNSSGGNIWLQGKFWGGNDTNHGFRIYDTNTETAPLSVDGTGNVTASQINTTIITFADGSQQTTAGGSPFELSNGSYYLTVNDDGTITLPDGSVQTTAYPTSSYDQANSAYDYAQAAFDQANLASDGATSAGEYANSALSGLSNKYDSAGGTISGDVIVTGNVTPTTDNVYSLGSSDYRWKELYVGPGTIDIGGVKLGVSDTGSFTVTGASNFVVDGSGASIVETSQTANLAYVQANTATSYAESAGTYANGAFIQANTATSYAESAGSYANSSFRQANVATGYATTAGGYANSAYTQANTATGYATTAGGYANSAYVQANTATAYAQSAGSYANSAFTEANSAYSLASTKLDQTGGTISGSLVIQHDLTVNGNVTYTGNVNSLTITGNTGQFFGYSSNGFNAFYAGIPTGYAIQPNEVAQFTGANNSYVQINFQNENGGPGATTDWIATANNGTNYSYYVDMGIAGSGYVNTSPDNSLGTSLMPNDSYLYAQGDYDTPSNPGGNLVVGATSTGKSVRFIAGGINSSDIILELTPDNVKVNKAIYFPDATTQSTAAISATASQVIYNQANTATSYAQSAGTYANSAFVEANTATAYAQSAGNYANSAFNKANTVETYVQAAGGYANSAFAQANIATGYATTAGGYANSAYTQANTATSAVTTAGGYANSAFAQANAAFAAANTALAGISASDQWARDRANTAVIYSTSAGSYANSAFDKANAAYNLANTGGGGGASTDAYARSTANSAYAKANTANVTYTASATSPSTPKLGDLWFNTGDSLKYEYATDGTNFFWWDTESTHFTGSSYLASATAPAAPNLGDMWYNTVDNITYIFSSDGTNTFWWDTQSSSTISTSYIPISKRDSTVSQISISNGYISITTRSGTTANVATY